MYVGELVRLRAVEDSDVDHLMRNYNTLELRRYTGVPLPRSRSETENYLRAAALAHPWNDGYLILAIEERESREFLGIGRLFEIEKPHNRARLGLSIYDPEQRGKGYGKDATRVLLWVAFNILGLHTVNLDTMEDNERAIHVFREVGFRRVGVLRETEYRLGQYTGLLLMDILRSEFEDQNRGFSVAGKI